MTTSAASTIQGLLSDAFDRVSQTLHSSLEGLPTEALTWRPGKDANTIAWLAWHLTRVQDDHLTGLAHTLKLDDREQVWTGDGWYDRFGLPFEPSAHGYGQSSEDVAAVKNSVDQLLGYHDAVAARTRDIVGRLTPDLLEEVIDENWDPPVTAASRIVSVVNDTTQHVGQIGYVKGLFENR